MTGHVGREVRKSYQRDNYVCKLDASDTVTIDSHRRRIRPRSRMDDARRSQVSARLPPTRRCTSSAMRARTSLDACSVLFVCRSVGYIGGSLVGIEVGASVGKAEIWGCFVGMAVGVYVGIAVGIAVGSVVGSVVGAHCYVRRHAWFRRL